MHYDPIKNIFAKFINTAPVFRVLFFKLLDLMFLRSWYVRRELRKLRKELDGRIDIYDAGTGYGQYAYYMAKKLKPNAILAVDVKEDWINDLRPFFAKKKMENVTLAVEDLTAIDHENRFDLIVNVDVMEHIEDDRKVFENFYKALKPGGYVLINTPSLFGGSDVHEDEDESFIGEHARDGYSLEDLTEKLTPFGFKIHQHRYTYGFWGDKAWRLGIKYPIMMVNISKILLVLLPFYYLVTFPFTLLMMYVDYKKKNEKGAGINLIAKKP